MKWFSIFFVISLVHAYPLITTNNPQTISQTYIKNTITPPQPPTLKVALDNNNQVKFYVNLSYIVSDQYYYTYYVDFIPWFNNLNAPTLCAANRLPTTYQSIPWAYLWNREAEVITSNLNVTAVISTPNYYAWPNQPTQFWETISYVNKQVIQLTSKSLSLDYLKSTCSNYQQTKQTCCPLRNTLTNTSTLSLNVIGNTTLNYQGTLYVTFLQPGAKTNQNIYQATYYYLPFSVFIPTASQTLTQQSLNVSLINAYTINTQQLINNVGQYYYTIQVLTQTPPNYNIINNVTQITSYNCLSYYSASNNLTANQTSLTFDSQNYCNQYWSFVTRANNDVNISETFSITYQVYTSLNGSDISLTLSSVNINISLDAYVQQQQTIYSVVPFNYFLNLNYENASLNTLKNGSSVLDPILYGKFGLDLLNLNPGLYSVGIQQFYICYVMPGGIPPSIGYSYGIYRQGCAQPEIINGVPNISPSNIFTVYNVNNLTTLFNYSFINVYPPNYIGFQFLTQDIVNSVQDTYKTLLSITKYVKMYIQINSILNQRQQLRMLLSVDGTNYNLLDSIIVELNDQVVNNDYILIIYSVFITLIVFIIFIAFTVYCIYRFYERRKRAKDPITSNLDRINQLVGGGQAPL